MKKILLSALWATPIVSLSATTAEPPKAYVVSDAHLDTQWNWDVQTTIRDHVWKTINQNLFLLGQYPDYIFNFEGGVKYNWMKEYYPREFELVKDYVKQGRWHLTGSSWDANDVIMPSVESQIRNIMLGQNFYRKEFGREGTDIFLPDCFGFGWTLPTIASHCGLIGFSSQKLDWRTHPFYGDSKLPFTIGLWQGVDGKKIMFAHGYDYNFRWNDVDLSEDPTLLNQAGRTPLNTVYRYYGTGDTGGSPTIASVASVEKGIHGDGPVEIISATSDQLYQDYLPFSEHPELPVYDGELLMDVHGTGCYTSQAAMKLYNRQNEQLGDAAERAAVVASLYSGAAYPAEDFTQNWKRFIWHQFHDDLTGTSIPRAYEFSWNDELLTLKQFTALMNHAMSRVAANLNTAAKGTPVVIFNPLGYEVSSLVEIAVPAKELPVVAMVKGPDGKPVRAQVTGFDGRNATVLVEATVPSIGAAVYDVVLSGKGKDADKQTVKGVENSVYKLTFDENGDIASLLDKRSGKELVKEGEKIRLALFPDNKSYSWPAWEILKTTIDGTPVSITDDVEISLEEDGALRKRVKVAKRYGDSKFIQYINLYEGDQADRIDFENRVDWATTNALVKAEFPLSASNEKATYDLGVGVAQRGNNTETAYEVPAQQWADLSDKSGSHGATILTDSKYGWDKPDDNTLRLTLLHTPQTQNNFRYQDHQDFGHHEFTYSLVSHAGALDRVAAVKEGEKLNQGLKAFVTDKHKGDGKVLSLAGTDAPNMVIKAMKGAEDGDGYVVRVYETSGQPVKGNIVFDREVASARMADGTEKVLGELPSNGRSVPVELDANGIATVRVSFATPREASPVRMAALELPYNKKAYTWNEFRNNGDFAGGYTYAAELIPDTLVTEGIEFRLEPRKERNAVAAGGQVIEFPEGEWSKLHILAAAATEAQDIDAVFNMGRENIPVTVPSYTGFVGQWGHTGHTEGYLKPQKVAYVGTHRHSGRSDEPYEYTYMYHYTLDIPKGVKAVTLPENNDLVVFAATVANGEPTPVTQATRPFKTGFKASERDEKAAVEQPRNILTPEMVAGYSGFVNEQERPGNLVDGDESTKWCDISGIPSFVDFDLGKEVGLSGWKMVNAASEDSGYVTSTALLMGRNSTGEEWQTLDVIAGNKMNVVRRNLESSTPVRYLRLMVTSPNQDPTGAVTRIYEFEAYD